MIKKTIFTLLVCCLIVSCGKKGDPKYIEPENLIKLEVNSG